jgi:hypothetical protein
MKIGRFYQLLLLTVTLIAFLTVASSVMALPLHQGFPCFGGEGCPEPVNPEEGEYYAVQCTNNVIWVWRTTPNPPTTVTGISMLEVNALNDGDSLVAPGILPGNVTVTRSGDTITLSGENGNFAPQPGEKSFSWSECLEYNGDLPEFQLPDQELTDEQIACMNLIDEQEKSDCLNALASDTANMENCESFLYANSHIEECFDDPCESTVYASQHLEECTLETSYEVLFAILSQCFNPINPPVAAAAVVAFGAFRRRRRRK